jgi:hypothetical protein
LLPRGVALVVVPPLGLQLQFLELLGDHLLFRFSGPPRLLRTVGSPHAPHTSTGAGR